MNIFRGFLKTKNSNYYIMVEIYKVIAYISLLSQIFDDRRKMAA